MFSIFLIFIFLLSRVNLTGIEPNSDNASISGFIRDSNNGEPLIGATVRIVGTKYGAITNKNGYFSILDIPPGNYEILITNIGYSELKTKIELKLKQSFRKNFELKSSSVEIQEIQVEAEREVEKREINISKVNIPIQQISKIRIGGESDIFRSLQFLPGILTSSQISSGLYVRGGSPDQNLILIDGSTVYNPSHLFGFISTFNSDAIKDVELIKGGFPAEFGGRLSAVLNLTQKDGNSKEINGIGSIGVISSKLTLEGPLGMGSFLLSGRRTYFDLVKGLFPLDPENPLPDFGFYDLNAKLTQNISDNDKLTLSGFLSNDALDYDSFGFNVGLDIGNRTLSGKWTRIISDNLFSELLISSSIYKNNFSGEQSGFGFLVENTIDDITAKGSINWFTSDKITTKFGFESSRLEFKYLQNFTGERDSVAGSGTVSTGSTNLTLRDWNHSVFVQMNYSFTDLISMQIGLRANYWSLNDNLTFDPRIAFRWRMSDEMVLKAAWGIFHQNLRLATQPDFSFFDTWLPTDSTVNPTRAFHYILSLETEFIKGYNLNFDIYHKFMQNISEINTNVLEPKNVAAIFYNGTGQSYGFEVFLQKKFGRLTGWLGYSLGFIYAQFDSINNGNRFRPKYDRRHDLKIVAQYQIDDKWEINATFTFQSGQSYTGATSRILSRLPEQNSGRGKIIPSERYGLRLPPSHQLNISGSYTFKIFGADSRVILDIYNIYNRRDIWFRYYDTRSSETKVTDVKLLPILPTFSFEIKF